MGFNQGHCPWNWPWASVDGEICGKPSDKYTLFDTAAIDPAVADEDFEDLNYTSSG